VLLEGLKSNVKVVSHDM
jgi:hypothetical protein